MPDRKPFQKPAVLRIARKVASKQVCDHCLGRQFAMLSTGMTNRQRGEILRALLKSGEPRECSVCGNLFRSLEDWAGKAVKALDGISFSTFLVGTKLSPDLVMKEEELWEEVGITHCEPLKSELNRELGKLLHKRTGKEVSDIPDITVILSLARGRIELQIRPLFISGKYQKLVRGIPQTKWDTYPETVEDIIAAPLMKESSATAHSMHGAGREDIDARCLAWRPFVLELENPRKRTLPLRKAEKEINRSGKVKVKDLSLAGKKDVIRTKEMRPDKSYRVLAIFDRPVKEKDLASLKTLVGTISQKTPTRVLHRRSDLLRRRRVLGIRSKPLSGRSVRLDIRGEAGLYIKELVTGDNGRTVPSVSALLGPVRVKELDVTGIHLEEDHGKGKHGSQARDKKEVQARTKGKVHGLKKNKRI